MRWRARPRAVPARREHRRSLRAQVVGTAARTRAKVRAAPDRECGANLEGDQSPWKDRASHGRKRSGMLRTRRRRKALKPIARQGRRKRGDRQRTSSDGAVDGEPAGGTHPVRRILRSGRSRRKRRKDPIVSTAMSCERAPATPGPTRNRSATAVRPDRNPVAAFFVPRLVRRIAAQTRRRDGDVEALRLVRKARATPRERFTRC